MVAIRCSGEGMSLRGPKGRGNLGLTGFFKNDKGCLSQLVRHSSKSDGGRREVAEKNFKLGEQQFL
jgi:hypothetical protein